MDNYEERPLDVLLRDLFDLGALSEGGRWMPDDQIDYDTTVEAIKKAVIRDVSVGTLTFHAGMFGQTYGDKPIHSLNEGDRCVLALLPREA